MHPVEGSEAVFRLLRFCDHSNSPFFFGFTCLSVPGVMHTAYNIHKGTMSVEESVNNPPIAYPHQGYS